ncbi:MAG: NTP transferase domain-containing protein [Candidatus Odinarchaeum yellowstonii]|uniref:NTP transferase domain-containing protein n=1 Tax=Odinarchaeota yellowstonii (strain LCB_4) TaxID=1841599 RepID=A0AAF0D2R0_ODILC|nr:MAG: NTP transferase domain-containing protein [Candidatus Odinarchaeum yellowstonii]
MKTVILAAGRGERLQPLTSTRPKPMVYVGNKPLLQLVIENLRECGLKDIIIVVSYKNEYIMNYFENGYDFGVNIKYVFQKTDSGRSEDAILAAEPLLRDEPEFLIAHADFLVDKEMINRAINNYKRLKPEGVISVTLVKEPHLYGVVSLDEEARIKRIIEKPERGKEPSSYAVAGIYIFKSSILQSLSENHSLDVTIQNLINSRKHVYASVWEREWVKVRYPWDLLKANELYLKHLLTGKGSYISEKANISNNCTITHPVWIEEGVTVKPGAVISGPVLIDKNSFIGTNSLIRPYSTIGKNVTVGFGVEVKNSIIYDKTQIGRLSFIGDSIIGAGVEIGAGTQTINISFDKTPIKFNTQDETVDIPLQKFGSVIGDHAIIGTNVSILPGRQIGCNSIIHPGVILYQNVPEKSLVKVSQSLQITDRID